MTKESLLMDIYHNVSSNDYCSICFRTSKERRLLEGKNLAKFKYLRLYNALEVREDIAKYSNQQKICYMCDAQAIAANKFSMAINLSYQLHELFRQMKRQPFFSSRVIDHLTNNNNASDLKHGQTNVEDLQRMLEQLRRNTTLMQTETLLLNNPGERCSSEGSPPPAAAVAAGHESFRDLLAFEPQTELDDALFHLNASEMDTKQIIIEDDDPIKEEPPDPNMFIIPDKLPSTAGQTDNPTSYLLHPIVVNNGTVTIPSLDKNISINDSNLIVNGLTDNNNKTALLNKFVVTPLTQTQNTQKNTNQNMKFVQNMHSLAKNVVGLVKNTTTGQNILNFRQNTSNSSQNTLNLDQNKVTFLQHTSNLQQFNLNSTQKSNVTSYAMEYMVNLPSLSPLSGVVKKTTPVKVAAEPVKIAPSPVKRPDDSDSNTNCQNIQPIRKPEGKIDWEDKIPMDVISFVSPSDPMTLTPTPDPMKAKRQKVMTYNRVQSTQHLKDHQDPMDKCIITDVKSVRECEVIDLC